LYGDKPTPSGSVARIPIHDELEAQGFRLIDYVAHLAVPVVDSHAEASLLLVLSGQLKLDVGRALTPGDVTTLQGSQRLQLEPRTRLWQITGTRGLVRDLERLSTHLRRKDAVTAAHSARVARLALGIGQHLGLSGARRERLGLAAYLHDLGKLRLPSRVLQTPDSLTLAEWRLMVQHPSYGRQLLEPTPLVALAPWVEQHHERLDGSGYPFGLSGDAVQLESYIIAVADTFDAITHARPYRGARSPQEALSELNRYSDTLYPREVVAALNAATKTLSC